MMIIPKDYIAFHIETGSILAIYNDRVVLDKKNVICWDPKNNEQLVGEISTNPRMLQIYPIRAGILRDPDALLTILNYCIDEIILSTNLKSKFILFLHGFFALPSCLEESEVKDYINVIKKSKIRFFDIAPSNITHMIGIGIDITKNQHNIIIDISTGRTSITCASLNVIHSQSYMPIGVDRLNGEIHKYFIKNNKVSFSIEGIKKIWDKVGAAQEELEFPPEEITMMGKQTETGRPSHIRITHKLVVEAIDGLLSELETMFLEFIEYLNIDEFEHIYNTGIYLTGAGSILRGLDARISKSIGLPVYIAEDPERASVRGIGIIMKTPKKFRPILSNFRYRNNL